VILIKCLCFNVYNECISLRVQGAGSLRSWQSLSQVFRVLYNAMVYYRVYKSFPLVSALSHVNQSTPLSSSSRIRLHIILQSTLSSRKWSVSFSSSTSISYAFLIAATHATYPAHRAWFDDQNNTRCKVQIMKIMLFLAAACCYFRARVSTLFQTSSFWVFSLRWETFISVQDNRQIFNL
jgi:hypothetical protein